VVKTIVAPTNKDKQLTKQAQDISRLMSAIESATTTKNILKSFKRTDISVSFEHPMLQAHVDLTYCDRIRHFAKKEKKQSTTTESQSTSHIPLQDPIFSDGNPKYHFIPDFAEDQTPYRWIPDYPITDCETFSHSLMSVLSEEFPTGTDSFIGKWKPWKNGSK
jgi:hypothetical protein